MKKEIIISGFGGQGVLAIGKNLVEAGLEEGLEVTWAAVLMMQPLSFSPDRAVTTNNPYVSLYIAFLSISNKLLSAFAPSQQRCRHPRCPQCIRLSFSYPEYEMFLT